MKNITITVDEDVAKWAKVYAAQQDTSLSRLVGEMLRERMRRESGYAEAMAEYLAEEGVPLGGAPYPSREELHERDGLR